MFKRSKRGKAFTVIAAAGALSVTLAACGGSDDSGSGDSGGDDSASEETTEDSGDSGAPVAVSLITKDQSNPFFVAMIEGANEAAAANGVDLTVGSGKEEGDV